jgi:signal transduction histidine kinase
MKRLHLNLGWQDLVLLGLALLSIVLTGAQLASIWKSEEDSRMQTVHRQSQYGTTEELEDLLIQADASMRGFLLTGRKSYLDPYLMAVRELPKAIARMEQIRPSETDLDDVAQLALVSRQKVAELDETMRIYNGNNHAAAIAFSNSDQGRLVMEEAMQLVNRLQLELVRGITKQTLELEGYHWRGLVISLAGGSFSFILLCLSMIRLNRSFGQASELIQKVREGEHSYQLLADHVEVVREEERREMARRIHDEVGQALTATKLDLSMVERKLAGNPEVRDQLRSADEAISSALEIVRGISMELRPAILDALGLFAAVEWQAAEFAKRASLDVKCFFPSKTSRYDPAVEVSMFRIVQEALTNVVRHARASKVEIRGDEEEGLHLDIRDNGVGISKESLSDYRSMGLLGMKERARSVGGQLIVRPGPGGGTVVEVDLKSAGVHSDAA